MKQKAVAVRGSILGLADARRPDTRTSGHLWNLNGRVVYTGSQTIQAIARVIECYGWENRRNQELTKPAPGPAAESGPSAGAAASTVEETGVVI